jgi:hypothetical protein
LPRETVKFRHSNFPSEKIGEINFEASLVIKDDAKNDPVGEAQNEPNKSPYLPPPKRNPAPYQVLSGGLAMFAMLGKLKWIILFIIVIGVAGPLLFPMLLSALKG